MYNIFDHIVADTSLVTMIHQQNCHINTIAFKMDSGNKTQEKTKIGGPNCDF